VKVPVAAYLPEEYVKDVSQRLLFYKRYSMAQNEEELFDVHGELQERYGRAPQPVDSLRDIVRLKLEMKAIGAKRLEAGPNGVVVELTENTPLDPDKVIALIQSSKGEYEFRPQMTLVRRLNGVQGTDILAAALRVSREVSSCA
jgi:transcription-repair coupling factor (superfamily II helicase)